MFESGLCQAAELKRYDVGVDANGFKPVSIEEIIAFFDKKGNENELEK